MHDILNEKVRVFLQGSIAGVVAGINFLFLNENIYIGFLLKLGGTIIIALFTGMITLFAHDLYKWAKKKFKMFKHDDEKKDDETKAA